MSREGSSYGESYVITTPEERRSNDLREAYGRIDRDEKEVADVLDSLGLTARVIKMVRKDYEERYGPDIAAKMFEDPRETEGRGYSISLIPRAGSKKERRLLPDKKGPAELRVMYNKPDTEGPLESLREGGSYAGDFAASGIGSMEIILKAGEMLGDGDEGEPLTVGQVRHVEDLIEKQAIRMEDEGNPWDVVGPSGLTDRIPIRKEELEEPPEGI